MKALQLTLATAKAAGLLVQGNTPLSLVDELLNEFTYLNSDDVIGCIETAQDELGNRNL